MRRLLIVPPLVLLAACSSGTTTVAEDPTPAATSSASPDPAPAASQPVAEGAEVEAAPGRVVEYAEWEADPAAFDGTVVLYFAASWCHSCQATDESIAAEGVPSGLTLVKIDYDERTDLRQEYGVTVQHTFVEVDDTGARQDIWTGTVSGADILARAA